MCRELGGSPTLTALEKMTKILEAKPMEEPPALQPGGFVPSASLTRKPETAKEVLLIVVESETNSILNCEVVGDGVFGAFLHSLAKRRPELLSKAEANHFRPGYICYQVNHTASSFLDQIQLAMNMMTDEDIESLRDILRTNSKAVLNFYGSF